MNKPPEITDKHGQVIRRYDILRVFHFYGRRRGKGFQKHYMFKIAAIKNTKHGLQWWFHHTAEMGTGLSNGYFPSFNQAGQLKDTEVIDSPLTLREELGL